MDDISARLKHFRESLPGRPSQSKFGETLGLRQRAYGYYESGSRGIPSDVLALLASVYGLNIHWLITGLGPKTFMQVSPEAAEAAARLAAEESQSLVHAAHVEVAVTLVENIRGAMDLPLEKRARLIRLVTSQLQKGVKPEQFKDWVKNAVDMATT